MVQGKEDGKDDVFMSCFAPKKLIKTPSNLGIKQNLNMQQGDLRKDYVYFFNSDDLYAAHVLDMYSKFMHNMREIRRAQKTTRTNNNSVNNKTLLFNILISFNNKTNLVRKLNYDEILLPRFTV